MQLRLVSLAKGVASFVPGLDRLANSAAGTWMGARYYYSVWLRHLIMVHRTCGQVRFDVVAELGPGDALGVGLCALLSGASRYLGFDRIAFTSMRGSAELLDTLTKLFVDRAPVPDDEEFPAIYPRLHDHAFPHHILTKDLLTRSLAPERLAGIRAALAGEGGASAAVEIRYVAPWDHTANIVRSSVDWVLSQAVLEHVDDVDGVYMALRQWLKPAGIMSHRIDYTCHGITHDWFGHWTVPERLWLLARGKRAYFINRLPHSAHRGALQRQGFTILAEEETLADRAAPESAICVAHELSDLSIRGAFLIARSGEPM